MTQEYKAKQLHNAVNSVNRLQPKLIRNEKNRNRDEKLFINQKLNGLRLDKTIYSDIAYLAYDVNHLTGQNKHVPSKYQFSGKQMLQAIKRTRSQCENYRRKKPQMFPDYFKGDATEQWTIFQQISKGLNSTTPQQNS